MNMQFLGSLTLSSQRRATVRPSSAPRVEPLEGRDLPSALAAPPATTPSQSYLIQAALVDSQAQNQANQPTGTDAQTGDPSTTDGSSSTAQTATGTTDPSASGINSSAATDPGTASAGSSPTVTDPNCAAGNGASGSGSANNSPAGNGATTPTSAPGNTSAGNGTTDPNSSSANSSGSNGASVSGSSSGNSSQVYGPAVPTKTADSTASAKPDSDETVAPAVAAAAPATTTATIAPTAIATAVTQPVLTQVSQDLAPRPTTVVAIPKPGTTQPGLTSPTSPTVSSSQDPAHDSDVEIMDLLPLVQTRTPNATPSASPSGVSLTDPTRTDPLAVTAYPGGKSGPGLPAVGLYSGLSRAQAESYGTFSWRTDLPGPVPEIIVGDPVERASSPDADDAFVPEVSDTPWLAGLLTPGQVWTPSLTIPPLLGAADVWSQDLSSVLLSWRWVAGAALLLTAIEIARRPTEPADDDLPAAVEVPGVTGPGGFGD
jgi:hypothetical protein